MSKEEKLLSMTESGESEEQVGFSILEYTTKHRATGSKVARLLKMPPPSGTLHPMFHGLSTLSSCVEAAPALSFRQHTRRASDSFRTDMRITAGFSCTQHAKGREAH